jgi:F-type H+-transporting ATPase subunit gamma
MNLSNLKKKINTYQSTKKVTKAMQNIAAVKVNKIKQAVILSKSNINHLDEMLNPIKAEIDPNLVTYNVVFSPKKGLCGGLSRKILMELELNLLDNIIGVELPLSKLISEKGKSIQACFVDLDDANNPCFHLDRYLNSFLDDNEVVQIILHYPVIVNHQYSLQKLICILSPDYSSKLYLYSHLTNAYFETRLCEELKRIEAMQTASDNCGTLLESTKLKYNKTRQSKITAEILELSN